MIYANRGLVKLRQGKSGEADKDFAKSFELDPSLKQKLEPVIGAKALPVK
jgi:Tfp pilus assembly protein PilF